VLSIFFWIFTARRYDRSLILPTPRVYGDLVASDSIGIEAFVVKKLEYLGYHTGCSRNEIFSHFDRTLTYDRQTDGRTDGHRGIAYTALAHRRQKSDACCQIVTLQAAQN